MKYAGKGVGVTFKLGNKAVKGAFVYSLETLQFFNKYKLSIKFNNTNLYSGILIPEVNIVKKADLEKNLNSLTDIELDKLPIDENGIRLVEIDGNVITIGPEGKIDELVSTAFEKLDDYIKKLSNKNIREAIIYTKESREVAQKYFNKIKKSPKEYLDGYTKNLDNFDKWYSEVFQSNLFEAYHIIPKQVLDNADLKKILDWARKNNKSWDFGGLDNGVMLQKRKKNISGEIVGDHANHPNYNTLINPLCILNNRLL